MDSRVRKIDSCRICGRENLEFILSLGEQHISDFIDSPDDDTIQAPLNLVLCNEVDGGCGLLQLEHSVDPDYLFKQYWYKSGINESMIESLNDIKTKAIGLLRLSENDIVLDIGCNDGTMLRMYDDDLRRVGFEPAENLIGEAREGTTRVINDYFRAEPYNEEFDDRAKLVTSIAMFYDLDDPNAFVADVADVLADDGMWVIQMSYFPRKLRNNAFDSIVHEHLEYYSLLPLENLVERHGLEVFAMEKNDVNGGSFRVYIRHDGSDVTGLDEATENLDRYRAEEREMGLYDKSVYKEFGERIEDLKERTTSFIEEKVDEGNSVYVYGASTKGNTLLQYYGLDDTLIDGAAERNPKKYGKYTVGTHIPIVPEEEAREEADYFLALPWHFMDVFLEREREWLEGGGKFIKPLPELEVLGEESIPENTTIN